MLDACQTYDPDDQASVEALRDACSAAKAASRGAALDDDQKAKVAAALGEMGLDEGSFVAVRSSSPEEDLAGMSFAGGYETVLGVRAEIEAITEAVRHVFASCLDERVFVYKIRHGIADLTPRIAVVVQRQVAASVAGVAFSLDPISNCYDWGAITTNWGLGESVVSGQCSPDYYLVNKVTGAMIKKELGKKERSVWLGKDGGVYEEAGPADEFTLSDKEVATVVAGLSQLESFYGHPVDTEFALDGKRQLLWLQARPITTHIELPQQITSPPGGSEVLWVDVMQVVQGFTSLASVTGMSFLQHFFGTVLNTAFGLSPARATMYNRPFVVIPESGTIYMNGSFILRLIGFDRKDSWADKLELMDFSTAKVIRELEDRSLAKSASLVPLPLLLAWNCPGLLANIRKNLSYPDDAARRADDMHAAMWTLARELHQLRGYECSAMGAFQTREEPSGTREFVGALEPMHASELLAAHAKGGLGGCLGRGKASGDSGHALDVLDAVMPAMAERVLKGGIPAVAAGGLTMGRVTGAFERAPEDVKALLDDVSQGTTFVTTDLSLLLEDMAGALEEAGQKPTVADLLAGVNNGGEGLPPKAWEIWRTVIDQFGHRGVGELDISSPRYREEPDMLLEQVVSICKLEGSMRPRSLAAASEAKREAAVTRLSEWLSANGGDVEAFEANVRAYHSIFRYRESPKYLIIKFVDLCRQDVLAQAAGLVRGGRLDEARDVWWLTLDDLRRVHRDEAVDVRALIKERRAHQDRNAHVKSWPKVVTSRGRVMRSKPREAREGEVAGHPVSAGVARGRVKVLRDPREKPLLTGEILVAQATDPGWTPLFVPAAAVLLEVGGALQHGALVAREFGKPCVAGIDDVLEKFKDGQLVEVDGSEGIVRILEEPEGAQS